VLFVALKRGEQPVGLMTLDNPGNRMSFTEDQQQLARSIGQQAAVAIDNARLYQEAQIERARAERLIERAQAIYQVAMAVNSDAALPDILKLAAHHLSSGLHAGNVAMFLLENERLQPLNHDKRGHTPYNAYGGKTRLGASILSFTHCNTAIQQQHPLFIYHHQLSAEELDWFESLGMENILILPLFVGTTNTVQINEQAQPHKIAATPRCVGFAFVDYPHNSPEPVTNDTTFARDLAAHCALAIDKARIQNEAKQAMALAHERANTLNAIFNAMSEGLIVLDLQGKVLVSNASADRAIGLTRKNRKHLISHLRNYPIYTLSGQPIAPRDFPLIRALRGEHVHRERFLSYDRDGTERITEMNIVPLLNNDAKKIGIVGAFRDITEQARIERRIRRALDTMLHAVKAVTGLTETREILQRVLSMALTALNSERGVVQLYHEETQSFTPLVSIGFTPREAQHWQAQHLRHFMPDEQQAQEFQEQLKQGFTAQVSEEHYNEHTNQHQRSRVLTAPILHNKRLLGIMILDRSLTYEGEGEAAVSGILQQLLMPEFNTWDIAVVEGIAQFAGLAIEQTRWQQAAKIAQTNEATMRESNELKDEFLAITAHEFRTPLTVILAHGQRISRLLKKTTTVDLDLHERLEDSIASIEEQTYQLTNIVTTFLEVTRLNRGQLQIEQEQVDVEELIKETVSQYGATSTCHTISYQVAMAQHPYLVTGDRARLLQIFANLLQNAIKYSPQGGPITLTLTQQMSDNQPMAAITFADKGIGVPLDAQRHLFERFYRASNISNSHTRGVGLGLYVVAELLHLHGGTIRIESSGIPGEGSNFILTLPLLNPPQTLQTTKQADLQT
jgi:PAS domain S-box-containing protein